MCGIFGVIASDKYKISGKKLRNLLIRLYELSETRGKDASGILSFCTDDIFIYKTPSRAKKLVEDKSFQNILSNLEHDYDLGKPYIVAGHTRMVTNGSADIPSNNQPIHKDGFVLLHNGIIVNDEELWVGLNEIRREYEVDTEVFSALMSKSVNEGETLESAMQSAFEVTKGANTLAVYHRDVDFALLGTTNGSLYFLDVSSVGLRLYASELYILKKISLDLARFIDDSEFKIIQIKPGTVLKLYFNENKYELLTKNIDPNKDLCNKNNSRKIVDLSSSIVFRQDVPLYKNIYGRIEKEMQYDEIVRYEIKRCKKCLLPKSFPFIVFDDQGVCQFCRNHKPMRSYGADALRDVAENEAAYSMSGNCLVPISGGRDSCFGLHYVKKELGLAPVAYTYDWGFVTDLARRNISRMCGELNVEHVLVAADIKTKRMNVRKNVLAWLAKPSLSMIPLFMAGDKAFFYYASMVKKQSELGQVFFAMNRLEKTGFKTGFAGVNETGDYEKTYGLTPFNQVKLVKHYFQNFITNYGYINSSVPDTLFGYLSYYMQSKDYYSIFDYLRWDESTIENCIINDYGWETAPDTRSTWRIGDGTAPFYNYIYNTVAGFSEYDTFRSNQIREGMIDRNSALNLVVEENKPRIESFKWYCDTIGIDAVEAIRVINRIPKLY